MYNYLRFGVKFLKYQHRKNIHLAMSKLFSNVQIIVIDVFTALFSIYAPKKRDMLMIEN